LIDRLFDHYNAVPEIEDDEQEEEKMKQKHMHWTNEIKRSSLAELFEGSEEARAKVNKNATKRLNNVIIQQNLLNGSGNEKRQYYINKALAETKAANELILRLKVNDIVQTAHEFGIEVLDSEAQIEATAAAKALLIGGTVYTLDQINVSVSRLLSSKKIDPDLIALALEKNMNDTFKKKKKKKKKNRSNFNSDDDTTTITKKQCLGLLLILKKKEMLKGKTSGRVTAKDLYTLYYSDSNRKSIDTLSQAINFAKVLNKHDAHRFPEFCDQANIGQTGGISWTQIRHGLTEGGALDSAFCALGEDKCKVFALRLDVDAGNGNDVGGSGEDEEEE